MNPLRVLYVDDDPDIRDVAELALQRDPAIEVRIADGGAAALSVLADWSPDVVMLDVMMPGMDGPAVLAELRARRPEGGPAVVFITARALEAEVADLVALGARGVITKPFDPLSLAADLRRILEVA